MLNIPLMMADDGLVRSGLVAEYRFDDVKNIMPIGSDNFVAGWAAQNGATVTLTQNQSVPEWSTDKATRIQTSGGTATVKYVCIAASPSVNGQTYYVKINVKNIGSKAVRVNNNISGTAIVNPGESTIVAIPVTGNGSTSIVLRFLATDAADALDFLAFQPIVSLSPINQYYPPVGFPQILTDYSVPDINLVPAGKETFEGWTAYSGAAVTLTQNQSVSEWGTDKATRIQTSGGTSAIKYYLDIGSMANGQKYSSRVKVKNIGSTTLKVRFNSPTVYMLTINAGETRDFEFTDIGNGIAYAQLQFQSANISDSLDFIAYQPIINYGLPVSFVRPRYNGQLGSTTGSDTNDPIWNGQGLSFATDDYVKLPLPSGFNVANDFTFFVACNVKATPPSVNETFFSLGNSTTATAYLSLYQNNVGAIGCFSRNDASQSIYQSISTQSGDRLLMVRKAGATIKVIDIASGVSSSGGTFPAMPMTLNQMTLGALGRMSYSEYLNGPIYGIVPYNRAVSDGEIPQIYRTIKRTLAQRGITI